MAYFVPCTTAFEDAVKDRTSARYWQVLIDIDDDDVLEDVTDYIANNDVSGSGRLEGLFNEAVSNQYRVTLRNPGGIFAEGDFAFAKCEIRAKVGTAEYITIFTGFVDEEGCARSVAYASEDVITVTMFDRSKHIAMRRKVPEAVYVNFKICDSGATSTSIFHQLVYLLGLSDSDLILGGAINYTKPYLALDGNSMAWAELQALAVQYLGQLTFRYDGKLMLRSRHETGWSDPSSEWTFSEAEENIHKGKMRGGKIIANRVKTEFDVHTVLSQRQIYRSVQGYNVVTGKCSIPVSPGEYWPGGTNDSDAAELKYLEPDTGEEYPIAINIVTPSIGASGSGNEIECDGGVLTLESFNGVAGTNPSKTVQNPGSSQIILKNTTGSTVTITKLDLYGQPIRIDEKVIVRDQDGTVSNEWEYRDKSINGKYAVSPAQATITTQWWVEYGKVKRKYFEIETDWIPQVQEGALVDLVMPTYDINMTCEVVAWNHPAAKGSMGKQITKLTLREWITLSPAADPESTTYQAQALATSEGVDDTAQLIANRPTYTEIQDGYDEGGGTTTPSTPTIVLCQAVGKNAIFLMADVQLALTNFKRFEWQVCADSGGSPDGNWYELEFDGSDWKDQADPFFTSIETPTFSHVNIPYTGTVDDPAGRKLHYRCRRVNKDDDKSSWSSTANATTKIVDSGDIAANSIYAASLIASEINTLLLRATAAIIVGFSGSDPDSPAEGDLRTVITDEVIKIAEEYSGGEWSTVKGIVLGVLTALISATGIYHPSNPLDSIEFFPNNAFYIFNFEGNYNDQYGADNWDYKSHQATTSSYKKFGTQSLSSDSGSYPCVLRIDWGALGGSDQSAGVWVYFAATPSGQQILLTYAGGAPQDAISLYIYDGDLRLRVTKNGTDEINEIVQSSITTDVWHFFAFSYDSGNDTIYVIYDTTIITRASIGGSWAGRDLSAYIYAYAGYSSAYQYMDEFAIAIDQYITPDIWVQHFNHDKAWNTDYSAADIILRCNTGGQIVADGQLKITGASRVRVTKDDAQTITDATTEVIEYDDIDYDNLSEWDNTNHRFYPILSGYYRVKMMFNTASVAWTSGDSIFVGIYKNGTQYSRIGAYIFPATITDYGYVTGSDDIYLVAGDYIDLRVIIIRGANTNTRDSAMTMHMSIHRLS